MTKKQLAQHDRARLESVREARRRTALWMEADCRSNPVNKDAVIFGAGYVRAMEDMDLLLNGIRPTGPRWDARK